MLGLDDPAFGADERLRAGVEMHDLGVFEDLRAQAFGCCRLAEHQVERMDMAAVTVDHTADIAVGPGIFRHLRLGHHFQSVMAMLHPVRTDLRHLLHLLVGESREEAAVDEIAFDPVFGDALANDPATFERHLAQPIRPVLTIAFGDRFEVPAIAVHDLPAIAARCTETDAIGFEHDDGIALFRQFERCRDAGKTGTDDADIGRVFAVQRRAHVLVAGRGRIVGGRMAGIGSDRLVHGDHLIRSGYRRRIRRRSHAKKTRKVPDICRRNRGLGI